jgi:replicative DNA helicase
VTDLFADLESERMVLGAAVVDNAAMHTLAGMLTAKHFSDTRHRLIFEAMLSLYQRSQPIDYLTLRTELADSLALAGGMEYLSGLDNGMPRVTNPEQWAKHVIDKARRRAARTFATRFLEEIGDGSFETEDLIERHQENLTRMQQARTDGVIPIEAAVKQAVTSLERFSQSKDGLLGVPCGVPEVDRMLSGWQPGALYVVAARPGRGKSVFCAQSAVYAAALGRQILYMGMEMRPAGTAARMICSTAGVDRWDLRMKRGFEERFHNAWSEVGKAAGTLSSLGIWFDERESPTVAQIKALAKQHQASRGLDLLVVDYLQRCSLPPGEDQWKAVGDVAKNLKSLAQALNIPVLAACQLGAAAEERRPTQADLAQARQVIAAEADVIVFLHPEQPEQWKSQEAPNLQFIVDKHRDGPTGDLTLTFDRPHVRFKPLGDSLPVGEW